MEPTSNKIQRLINSGYDFRLGDYLSKGFTYYRDHFVPLSLLIAVATIVPYILTRMGLAGLSGLLNFFIISPFMVAAIALYLRQVSLGDNPAMDFNKAGSFLSNLIVYNLIYVLIIIICMIPFIIFIGVGGGSGLSSMALNAVDNPAFLVQQLQHMGGTAAIVMLACIIPIVYFAISYWWTPYLIIYKNKAPWEAMETSRKLVGKAWGYHFLLALVIGLISLLLGMATNLFGSNYNVVAILSIITGVLIAGALSCILFASYEEIVGVGEGGDEENSDLIDHLVS